MKKGKKTRWLYKAAGMAVLLGAAFWCSNSGLLLWKPEVLTVLAESESSGSLSSVTEEAKILPIPNLLSTEILPLCSSISFLAILNPIPLPSLALLNELSTCKNGSNIFSIISSLIPIPLSIHSIIIIESSHLILICISLLFGLNLIALANILVITLTILLGSQLTIFSSNSVSNIILILLRTQVRKERKTTR